MKKKFALLVILVLFLKRFSFAQRRPNQQQEGEHINVNNSPNETETTTALSFGEIAGDEGYEDADESAGKSTKKPQKGPSSVLPTELVFPTSYFGKNITGGQILKIKRAQYCYFCNGNCSFPMQIENCEQVLLLRRNRTGCLSLTYPDGMTFKRCAYEKHARTLCKRTCKFVDCYFCRDNWCNLTASGVDLKIAPIILIILLILTQVLN